jgi:ribosomal protein S18 acetylase RimI-like enzyme
MRAASFPAFFETAVDSYARENVGAGRVAAADAVEFSRAETARLLPEGVETPDHQLFDIEHEGQVVGYAWLGTLRRGATAIAHVYQLIVLPEHRRRGHAGAALRELAASAAAQGHDRVELHVFAQNDAARALYASLGFEVASLNLGRAC